MRDYRTVIVRVESSCGSVGDSDNRTCLEGAAGGVLSHVAS